MVDLSKTPNKNMIYRYLGNTGLKVSVLAYGNWLNSDSQEAYELTRNCMKACYDAGVNLFDTAEIYGSGEAEKQMGRAIKELGWRREDLVITTKLWKCGNGVNDKMLSRKHILEAIDKSLSRLQMDYVDVVFCHRPDYECTLEETCRAMHTIVEDGKAFYWGTSEWPAQRIAAAIGICDRNGWHKPITEQPQYNMLRRERFEKEYGHLFFQYGYGSTVWSPLCMGLLTGKYNDGSAPDGSRLASEGMANTWKRYFADDKREGTTKMLKALGSLAEELGCTQAQLALAWTIANKDVSTALCGFTKVSQVEENLKALEVLKKWSKEVHDKIEGILSNAH